MRWSCSDCEADPALRRLRGRCEGPLHAALPGIRIAPDGALEVRGEDVVAGARGSMQDRSFRTCPVAIARRPEVGRTLRAYRGRQDGYGSAAALPRSLEELVDVAGREVAALRAWQLEREEMSGGS